MSSSAVDPAVVQRIERACTRAATGDELFAVLNHEVGKAVPFDASMWFGVDPATLLAVAPARFESLDEGYCQTLWDGEFHDQDSALYRDLARQPMPAASLRATTADRPLRSPRYRRFVQPQGYDDELRVAFRSGDSTWALGALYREKGRSAFRPEEVALMGAISGVVGAALRTRMAMGGVPPALSTAPGLLISTAPARSSSRTTRRRGGWPGSTATRGKTRRAGSTCWPIPPPATCGRRFPSSRCSPGLVPWRPAWTKARPGSACGTTPAGGWSSTPPA